MNARIDNVGPVDLFSQVNGLPQLIRGNVRVDWVDLDEGLDGNVDPDDAEDQGYLRFDLYRRESESAEWEEVSGGSFCTLVTVGTPAEKLKLGLLRIMDATYAHVCAHGSAKRICEDLSWMSCETL